MAIITGKQYLDRIDSLKANVWYNGERIKGKISEHPAFSGVMKSQAALYDMQNEERLRDLMTFVSKTTGELTGTSFMTPKTKEDLEKDAKWCSYGPNLPLG